MNDNALYDYKYFESYFTDNNRIAFFVKEKETNKLLGFSMINDYMQKSSNGHSIAEFLIIPKYRKNHIGKRVAFDCFNMYKGNWEVSPSLNNERAYLFWNNVINEYTNGNYRYEEKDRLFIFNN